MVIHYKTAGDVITQVIRDANVKEILCLAPLNNVTRLFPYPVGETTPNPGGFHTQSMEQLSCTFDWDRWINIPNIKLHYHVEGGGRSASSSVRDVVVQFVTGYWMNGGLDLLHHTLPQECRKFYVVVCIQRKLYSTEKAVHRR